MAQEDVSPSLLMQCAARRFFLRALGAWPVLGVLGACDWLDGQSIRIAAHVWVGYEPMFLAEREGWLDQRRVRLVETAAATDSLRALAEGRVDGAALTLDETLQARQDGVPLSVVAIFDISAGADMLLARPEITRLEQIKGKRLGFEQSSVGEYLLAEILHEAGLLRTDLRLVPLSVDQHLAAWQRNELDAVVTYEPVGSQLLDLGANRLFDSRSIPNTIVDVLAIRSDLLDNRHADAIRHLLQSHFRALQHFNHNPQDAAYRMASHLKLHAAEVLPAFKGLVLPDAANNYRLLAGANEVALLGTARKLSSVMFSRGLLKRGDTLDALVNADFLPLDGGRK